MLCAGGELADATACALACDTNAHVAKETTDSATQSGV
jgi:hypothetical protein